MFPLCSAPVSGNPERQAQLYRGAVATLLAMLIVWWILLLTRSFSSGMGQDFTTTYVAIMAWLHGGNPYVSPLTGTLAAHLHIRYQGFIDPPILLAAFAPLTLVPPKAAFVIFAGLQYICAAAGAHMLTIGMRRPWRRLVLLAIVASPPVFLAAYYGQIGTFVCLAVCLGIWATGARRWGLVGLCCVACLAIKPQLGICVGLPLLWRAPRRAWLGALVTAAVVAAVTVALLGVHETVTYIQALRDFSASRDVTHNNDGMGLASLYSNWLPHPITALLTPALSALFLLGIASVLMRTQRPFRWDGVAIVTLLGALLLPYSHQYDSVVLLPALLLGLRCPIPSRLSRLCFSVGMALAMTSPLMALSAHPIPFRLLPLGVALSAFALFITCSRLRISKPLVEAAPIGAQSRL